MNIIGIIAEYNPFHRGHAWQIDEIRRTYGADCAVVCAMSGNWVQRGECALADKWTRGAAALRGGADLVLELPTPWAVSSAEGFARGGVGILAATGVVDTLCFGSEAGALEELRQTADCLESEGYRTELRRELGEGISFASARQRACRRLIGGAAECLTTPNNNLAVEYLRALPQTMGVYTVKRAGADHDGGPAGGFASASYLRELLRAGETGGAEPYLTEPWGGETASMTCCERAVLARLRGMRPEELAGYPGGGEGLAARVLAAAQAGRSLEEVYALAKTKRYAHSRVRRLVLWAYLGLTAADVPEGPPYLRVLGFTPRGRAVLREMWKKAKVPVLTKPAHVRDFSPEAQRLFEAEVRCTDLFGLCYREIQPGGGEWTTGPVVLKESDGCLSI